MSTINLQTIVAGTSFPKQKASNTLAIDFLSVGIGADALAIAQGGTGGSAYFDLGARAVRSSFEAAVGDDLTNLTKVNALIAAQALIRVAAEEALQDNIDLKLSLSGGTMTGAIAMGTFKITGLGTPDADFDAATKKYVDDAIIASDLSAYFKKDGSVAATGSFDLGANQIIALADPTAPQHAATKAYVDAVALGLAPKKAVRAASLVNVDVASALIDASVVDGVTLATGDRVLLKNQTVPAENGIYIVAVSGAAARASDMDSLTPIDEVNGAWVPVQAGSQIGQVFVQYGLVTTIGSSPINFEFYNPIASLVGGDMITASGSTFSVDLAASGGLESTNPGNVAGQLQVKIDGTTISRSSSGIKVNDSGITELQLSSSVAGDGLSGGDGVALSVTVDGTLSIIGDAVGVQYASVKTNDNAGSITAGKVVYIKTNGNVDLATKVNAIHDTELGLVQDASIATTAAGLVIFKRGAHVTGFSGLTSGAEYFVDASGDMALYSAITYAVGEHVFMVGKALNATTLIYNPTYKFEF